MRTRLTGLLEPMLLAGLLTLAAIGYSLRHAPAQERPLAIVLLLGFVACFLASTHLCARRPGLALASELAMPLLALGLLATVPRVGSAQILTVIWVAVVVERWPLRRVLPAVLAVNVAGFFILRGAGYNDPLLAVILFACFQAFAGLVVHNARSAGEARDRLAHVNADLLATRALLADAARDGERLRVARELHDVAGHKLTALRLNLRALQAASPSPQLQLAEQLSAELLADIRGVVHALRDTGGLDIDTALRALAAPFPRPALRLSIAPGVVVADPALAEAVLRTVQEALTNAARHGDAGLLDVRLLREGDRLRLEIEDDGHVQWPLQEGNGLTGMRERIAALAGRLALSRGEAGGLRVVAELPA